MLRPEVYVGNSAHWRLRGPQVTVPKLAVECVVHVRWQDGSQDDVPARARAWSPQAVEVSFSHPRAGIRYSGIWLALADVRRPPEKECFSP